MSYWIHRISPNCLANSHNQFFLQRFSGKVYIYNFAEIYNGYRVDGTTPRYLLDENAYRPPNLGAQTCHWSSESIVDLWVPLLATASHTGSRTGEYRPVTHAGVGDSPEDAGKLQAAIGASQRGQEPQVETSHHGDDLSGLERRKGVAASVDLWHAKSVRVTTMWNTWNT